MGLIPAAIVGILLLGGLVALAIALPGITVAITPFADGWPGLWATVIRATLGTAMVGRPLVLVAVSFTALTLIIGEPFYERIWRSVERDLGDADIDAGYGFWRSVRDGLLLFVRGVAIAVLAALDRPHPGRRRRARAPSSRCTLTGWLLADELSSRALTARGLDHSRPAPAHARPSRARARVRRRDAAVLHGPARRRRDDACRRRGSTALARSLLATRAHRRLTGLVPNARREKAVRRTSGAPSR